MTAEAVSTAPAIRHVLVCAPFGGDARTLSVILMGWDYCADLRQPQPESLLSGVMGADVILLTAEALTGEAGEALAGFYGSEPVWSAPPAILLAEDAEAAQAFCARLRAAKPGLQVTVLMRPCTPVELKSAVAVAMESRRRQLTVRDLIEERQAARERADFLLAELRHRVKNLFAMVSAIGTETAASTADGASFAETFRGRIGSLAAAYDLLSGEDKGRAQIGDLVQGTVRSLLGQGEEGRVSAEGPPLVVETQMASALGLVLHELGANARKYGALSTGKGRVRLSWEAAAHGGAVLHWAEEGGPPVAPPTRRGFGSTMIEQSITGAKVDLRYEPTGLVCKIGLPPGALL